MFDDSIKIEEKLGKEKYKEKTESKEYVYEKLNYRNWEKGEDGNNNHV